MQIQIRFDSRYEYSTPVGFSTHRYRLLPRPGFSGVIRKREFTTSASAQVTHERDLFDNETLACFYPEQSRTLATSLRLELELIERDPFAFSLAPHATIFPFQYEARERHLLNIYLNPTGPVLPLWLLPQGPMPTVDAIVALNGSFRKHLTYERRDEGAARTPAETLAEGRGACRDFAFLLAEVLRRSGVAARVVSGYLVQAASDEPTAAGAFHAWTEAYLPGAGWIGLDPTNGTLCDHRHIPVAAGLEADDIAPSLGSYFHADAVPSDMSFRVEVTVNAS